MNMVAISPPRKKWNWVFDLLFIGVLLAAGFLRFTGADWGNLSIQHPDEDFLTSVTLGIQPVGTPADQLGTPPTLATQNWRGISSKAYPDCTAWGGYFDTNCSPLNPHNHGFSFYVYGDLPVIMTRYLATWLGQLDHLTLFGRYLSGVMDLGTLLLLFLIVRRVYNSRVALLASAFSALAVEQIQQSHFYTTDNFVVFFMFLTLYFAVLIATGEWKSPSGKPVIDGLDEEIVAKEPSPGSRIISGLKAQVSNPLTLLTIGFGIALGMAAASKINAAVIAVTLPVALHVRYFRSNHADGPDEVAGRKGIEDFLSKAFLFLIIGAVFSVLSFRVFQPYAFNGLGLDPQWLSNIREVRGQASPNSDLPWNLQWARRTHLYSFQNLTTWGLGLPLGILAWAGFLWMGWRMLKGEWRQHFLLWSWTAIYFVWQSLQYNPTMRYQLPIYPLLGMMAAWVVFDWARPRLSQLKRLNWRFILASTVGTLVLAATAVYAFAFLSIYIHPEPRIAATDWIFQNVPGPINLEVQLSNGTTAQQPLPFPYGGTIQSGNPYQTVFVAQNDGILTSILLGHVGDSSNSGTQTLHAVLSTALDPQSAQVLADLSVTKVFTPSGDTRGDPVTFTPTQPVSLQHGTTYALQIQTTGGILNLAGAGIANETDFDWNLPFRIGAYDPFRGIYRGDLNLQVYWDDNADKLARFQSVLDQTDFIFIPTNHQYAQITRIPERYPLTTEYYRQLIGCPTDKNIIWCYRVAEPGMFHGSLGFDLVDTFESYPTLGPLVINDESAEEAFTFYDHPKVLIFKKNASYGPLTVQNALGSVDYSTAIHLTPGQADTYKNLMLPTDQLAVQQKGGTWSDLFDPNALTNRYPVIGLVLWYLVIFALGLVVYPLVRAAFPGLADHGYPLARIVGLLLWAWLAWMAASLGLTYSRLNIGIALGIVVLIGLWQGWRQRRELLQEFREHWKYFLMVEGIFLGFFLVDLFIRIGNPDLWHPSKGGERPMDFAFFNAIIKSTTFPPYDPWFAGGYINYYYYGYVIVGTPVKLLGIVPSIAYNFILPTLFACLAEGAFSVGWNILSGIRSAKTPGEVEPKQKLFGTSFIGGISASSAMVLLGNLGILHMVQQGFERVAAPGGVTDAGNLLQHTWWTFKGFFMVLGGMNLPYGPGDWYWFSSRIFPPGYSDFYEFPVFTFLYSDLHAHMIALMLTVLVISWALSVLLSKARWDSPVNAVIGFFMGGLIIGSLKPTNTWDFYTYIGLGGVVLAYSVWRYGNLERIPLQLPGWAKRLLMTATALAALGGLSILLYQPFSHWFGQAYTSVQLWKGLRTPLSVYLIQWGVFLFFIVSWMTWETRQWLAETPVSSLQKLRRFRELIIAGLLVILLVLVGQQIWVMSPTQDTPWKGITILWLALPLAVWAAVLLFRPGISDLKRLVLFMTGTGLLLTMMVEVIVVTGDIGRFNTVFKFGVQTWVILGTCAAASFGWLLAEFRKWLPGWRVFWQGAAALLVAGAALVLVVGGADKIRDRMTASTPHTLDSMTYMAYATYAEYGTDMDLSEDYRAIQWMLANVQGSPVIVEAAPAGVQYAWLGRFSIYTGLPDVVGWEWHEEQQRVLDQATVQARGRETDAFYMTTDLAAARTFLTKYNVRYIIVGQLERAKYTPGDPGGPVSQGSPDGLLKFEANNNVLWQAVYRDGQTVIFKVLDASQVTP